MNRTRPNPPARIISLIPSATEIVAALGLADRLVGRSHECDFPAEVTAVPVCTEPKFDPNGSGGDIHQRVETILREALSVYRVHADVLRGLHPEVIVTQAQCDVCAVSLDEVERVVESHLDPETMLVSLQPGQLAAVLADIERVAVALGVPERGAVLVEGLEARLDLIAAQARALPDRPTVACVEWVDPLMAAGNWMPELVGLAGGVNLFGEAGAHSPWLKWADLRAADPDVIVVLPCGFNLDRTEAEMSALTTQPGWPDLTAVRTGRVYLTDGNQYFNRPGPRLVESLEILAEVLHPAAFSFGHEMTGWKRFTP